MKKLKSIVFTTLGLLLLAGCSSQAENGSIPNPENLVSNKSLVFQATTSLSLIDQVNAPMGLSMAKRLAKTPIGEEDKKDIEALLPTVSLILNNDKSFDAKVEDNKDEGKENYAVKQTITLTNLEGKEESYILYYNLAEDANTDNIVADLPDNEDEVDQNDDDDQDEIEDEKDDDEKDDDDEVEKEDEKNKNEKESTLVFNGIALKDNIEYTFQARSTEEIEDDETEKVFALRMFTSTDETLKNQNYIDVIHETEVEEGESETSYSYKFVENNVVVDEFEIEVESEQGDGINENEVEVTQGENEYEFTFETDKDNQEHIHVELEKGDEEFEPLHYVKVVNEDNTVTYTEVK